MAGVRGFRTDNSWKGFSGSLFTLLDETSCVAQTVEACPSIDRKYSENGETHRASLRWQVTPDKMVYFTYSTGFRPGGVNRDIVQLGQNIQIPNFKSDTISNYEVGWKTSWLDNRLIANGALFWDDWNRVQYPLPGLLATYYVVNAGQARSRGVEGNVTWKPVTGVTLYASARLYRCEADDQLRQLQRCRSRAGGHEIAPAADVERQRQRSLRFFDWTIEPILAGVHVPPEAGPRNI